MKLALFVTGQTGAGKSTLVSTLGNLGWHTYHTGDEFRRMFPDGLPIDGSAVSPESFDQHCHDGVMATIAKASSGVVPQLVAVESVPRNARQVQWLAEAEQAGYMPICLWLSVSTSIQLARVESRDIHSPDRYVRDAAKILEENSGGLEESIRVRCNMYGIPFRVERTDDWRTGSFHVFDLVRAAEAHYRSRAGQRPIDVRRMLTRCKMELDEAAEAVGTPKAEEELMDALWFLSMAMVGAGLDNPEKVAWMKARINRRRLETGTKEHCPS